jgi:hypothetical protein
MRPSTKLMAGLLVLVALLACGNKVTEPSETDSGLQIITYVCTSNEPIANFVSYRDTDSTSVILTDVAMPFSETVVLPEGTQLQVSMTKHGVNTTASVCILRGYKVVASDVAPPGDTELWAWF